MLFILLIVYQLKHFLADFPLQGKYMLGKFKPGWDFLGPLLAHVGVHGAFTLLIATLCHNPYAPWIATFDMVVHFTMDRIKASPKYLGRFKPLTAKDYPTSTDVEKRSNTLFWWSLGLDQMVHHLTHYIIIYWLVS
jgi:hypothetical protein